jgi:hypothetical protein
MPREVTEDTLAQAPSPAREPSRSAARDYYRTESRITVGNYEPHQKYHIDREDYPEQCDCVWVPASLLGMPMGVLEKYLANGWVLQGRAISLRSVGMASSGQRR